MGRGLSIAPKLRSVRARAWPGRFQRKRSERAGDLPLRHGAMMPAGCRATMGRRGLRAWSGWHLTPIRI